MSIATTDELGKIIQEEKNRPKNVLLVDGQMPNLKGKEGYFFYSDDPNNIETFDAAPYGLARISGYLDAYNVPNKIIRLRDFISSPKKEELEAIIKESDIIGISGLSNSAPEMFTFCLETKLKHPEKTIIGGREYFGLDSEWILKNKNRTGVDLCCNSQGELPILSLAFGVPQEKIGSITYEGGDEKIIKNDFFPRLDERSENKLLRSKPARELPIEWCANIFPEFQKQFKHCGNTMVGSGCPYNCDFCANSKFLESRKYIPSGETAKKEVKAMSDKGMDFFFVRDLLLNAEQKNLDEFIDFMTELNLNAEQKMKWAAFMSVKKHSDLNDLFRRMSDAGCVEIMVGVEDVVEDRRKLHKGLNTEAAAQFTDVAKDHMLVRSFLMLGLPDHYKYSKDEIKESLLLFMKEHPQAIYRIGLWTPIIGTKDFEEYKFALKEDVRENIDALKEHDTMHYVVDPLKIYDHLNVSPEKRYIQEANEWESLRNDVVKEYYESEEHREYLENLKGKEFLYESAKNFQEVALNRLNDTERGNEFGIMRR